LGDRVTTILGVRKCLKFVLGREQVAHPKPDPAIYLAAAEALGVRPERCFPPLLPSSLQCLHLRSPSNSASSPFWCLQNIPSES